MILYLNACYKCTAYLFTNLLLCARVYTTCCLPARIESNPLWKLLHNNHITHVVII